MATKPVPVRLDLSTIVRLDRAAKRLGTNRAALIKFCAQTFVADFEARGGIASLPPDWRRILRGLGGRRSQTPKINRKEGGDLKQSTAVEKPGKYRTTKKRK